MSHRTQVLEYSNPKVVGGVVKGVKIIGVDSVNGYKYRIDALKKGKPLYENAAVFIDHGNPKEKKRGSRQLHDHFGTLQAIRERHNGNGIYGDLHVKMSHPMADAVIEAVESGKGKFGLSHNAFVLMNDDETEVVEILEVNSVDLVDDPATTHNLFEEDEMSNATVTELKAALDKVEGGMAEQDKKLTHLLEAIEKIDPAKLPKPKPKRIAALEQVADGDDGDDDGEGLPVYGVTHEDFLAGLAGIRKGVTQ